MPRPHLAVFLAAGVLLGVGAAPATALRTTACADNPGFRCAAVTVPLDRTGAVPGTVDLKVAVQPPRAGATGFLLALSGGPGQPAVPYASSFAASLRPALAHRRLVVLDQRGTGASGVLRCPALQALGGLGAINTLLVEGCARALGPRRQLYGTADTVADIEALRVALRVSSLQLMGISYGTHVALQYARAHPEATEGLILDSTVGPDGIDAYLLDTFGRVRRVLAEQCARARCAAATSDPVADLAAVAARVRAAPLRGTVFDAAGRPRTTALHDESDVLLMLLAGDLSPYLQAALPAAMRAAADGDVAPLLRLRRYAQGPATPATDLSAGLNVATTCADVPLPYTFAAPLSARLAAWRHGTGAVGEELFAPFSRDAVLATSIAHDCLRWPQGDTFTPAPAGPLPDVPALILGGRLDLRTPLENARAVAARLPRAQLVGVGGTGHDVLDSDMTGCAARALARWTAGAMVGHPCRGESNAASVQARPPARLADYGPAPGVGGVRGRAVFAALDTVADAQAAVLQALYAGFTRLEGGGLRGGAFRAGDGGASLTLRDYALVPGVRVTGRLRTGAGTIRLSGPGTPGGTLRIGADGSVRGVLGGRAVRYGGLDDDGARAASVGGRGPARVTAAAVAQAVSSSKSSSASASARWP